MKTILIEGNTYQIGILNAFEQLKVARRLTAVSTLIQAMTSDKNKGKDMTFLVLLMLGELTDADSDFVVHKCLSVIKRQSGESYAKLTATSGDLMFQDIGMKAMIDLTTAVIVENLGDFFSTALSNLESAERAQV